MPIYMDRHYIEGATRHGVEIAHQKDLEIQDQYGVSFITYWFDEERCTAFCLIDAPDKETVRKVHGKAHGLVPHEIIEVDPSLVKTFLGRIEGPSSEQQSTIDSAFRAIMFTDIEESTALTTRLGDEEMVALLNVHNRIVRHALQANRGSEVKFTGDGFHASFASVTDAVKCAIQIQSELAAHNTKNPELKIHIRVGLSAGEPVMADRDLFGSTVNLAARLCAHAKPNQILVARVVRDLCMGKGFLFVEQDETMLKGLVEPVSLSEVSWEIRA